MSDDRLPESVEQLCEGKGSWNHLHREGCDARAYSHNLPGACTCGLQAFARDVALAATADLRRQLAEAQAQRLRLEADMESATLRTGQQANRIRTLEQRVAALDAAARWTLSNGMLRAHASHWDRKGTHGANCPACAANGEAADRLCAALPDKPGPS